MSTGHHGVVVGEQQRSAQQEAGTRRSHKHLDYQQISIYKEVNPLDWEDWHWQLKNRIRTQEELAKVIVLSDQEKEGIQHASGKLSMAITPYWASLMDPDDPSCPLRRQAVPVIDETKVAPHEMVDPCAEDRDSPAPYLVHRYPDRVLLLATEHCALYCRHCTRRRLVGEDGECGQLDRFDKALEYIRSNRKIRDVLISGGDPLLLEDAALEDLIQKIR